MITKNLKDILLRDHARIANFLNKWIKHIEQEVHVDEYPELYKNLCWDVHKHFFLEEKILYTAIGKGNLELTDENIFTINEFIAQHNHILKAVQEFNLDDITKLRKKIHKFTKDILRHAVFEEKNIYDVIDAKTPENKRKEIGDIVESDSNLGFYPFDKLRDYWRDRLDPLGIKILEKDW